MSLRLGDIAANFQQASSTGEIDFYQFLGDSWGYCFHILLTTRQYVPPSLALPQNSKMNLKNVE